MKRLFFWKKPDDPDGGGRGPVDPSESPSLLTGDPESDAESLEILLDTIAEVNSNIDLDRVLKDIVDKSVAVTRAERGLLLLGDAADDLQVRVARDKEGVDLGADVAYSKNTVSRCLAAGHAERAVVQSDREALELGQSVFNLRLRAVMCAPLRVRNRTIGVIYVDSTAVRREFSGRDLALFGALSAQLAIALENARLHADSLEKARLEKDFEIAKQIQKHLLADVPRNFPGLDLAVRFYARDEASGDTYDFAPIGGDRLVALIGDVTGHGVGAALLTHAAQAATRSYLELLDDLSEVMTRLNNRLCASVETGNFMSVLMVQVDPRRGTAHYVNAGHPPLLLVRDGEVRELEKTGMVLGVVDQQVYNAAGPVELQPGDLLFMRTDGVDETRNPERELFGAERLRACLRESAGIGAEAVLDRVEAAVNRFARGVQQDDDLTMVAIRIGRR
ncbi:MAG: SpoIIE family protein phosphatase [Planctomycetes bacterium]|nr:SpoIIE family protein phosphatase [Planctomycetota bacterium]